MSRFTTTLDITVNHWPTKTNDQDPMVRKFAEIATIAGIEEQDIAEFCQQLSNFQDTAFQRGVEAVHATYDV
jgi:hypothetical protein